MNKLRRQEAFMLQLPHRDVGYVGIWISPAGPLGIHFFSGRSPRIDGEFVEEMMEAASGPDGLTLTSR